MLTDPEANLLNLGTLATPKIPVPDAARGSRAILTGCAVSPSGEVLLTYGVGSTGDVPRSSDRAVWLNADRSVRIAIRRPVGYALWWLPDGTGVVMSRYPQWERQGEYFILDRNGDLWDLDTGGARILDVLPREALP